MKSKFLKLECSGKLAQAVKFSTHCDAYQPEQTLAAVFKLFPINAAKLFVCNIQQSFINIISATQAIGIHSECLKMIRIWLV